MISPTTFRDLVSGRQRGPLAALLRCGLRLIEIPYTWAVRWRNRRFDRADSVIQQAGVPVVSVGNLSLGGTGKTPMVEWIANWLIEHDQQVTLVSRGYGAKQGAVNDEALELAQKLPTVAHLQNPDRVAAAKEAVAKHAADIILLDDGFQHRRLHRDLDIVLIDALEPFGFEHVFPRGTLREPLTGLGRADVVALSRADSIDAEQRAAIKSRITSLAPTAKSCEISHAPRCLLNSNGDQQPLESLQKSTVAAFCGIGNPSGFRHTLDTLGYQLAAFREFPDHYHYTQQDLDELAAWAKQSSASALICTQKDLVKIDTDQIGELPLWAVAIGIEITVGQADLEACLQKRDRQDLAHAPRSGSRQDFRLTLDRRKSWRLPLRDASGKRFAIDSQHTLYHLGVSELRFRVKQGSLHSFGALLGLIQCREHCRLQLGLVSWRYGPGNRCFSAHQIENPSGCGRHNWATAEHHFDQHRTDPFKQRRHDKQIGRAYQVGHVVAKSQKANVVFNAQPSSGSFEFLLQRPLACQRQAHFGMPGNHRRHRFEQQIVALAIDQIGYRQQDELVVVDVK